MQSQKPPRPTGVTLIAILAILIGTFGLLGGIAIIGLSALISTSTLFGSAGGFITGLGLILGGIVVVFSLIWLATGFGFLHGKSWAWTLGMIFSVLSILGAVGFAALGSYSSIVGILLWGMMIYYLTRVRVKSFFGKGPAIGPTTYAPTYTPAPSFATRPTYGSSMSGTPMSGTPMGNTTSFGTSGTPTLASVPSSTQPRFCTNCGATITTGSTKCGSCGRLL